MFKVCKDKTYGYKKIVDINKDEIENLYKNEYWTSKFFEEKINQKNGGENFYNQISDLQWIEKTYFTDILDFVKIDKEKGDILDVGCGKGAFLEYMKKNKYQVYGVEPALELKDVLEKKGIEVFNKSIFDIKINKKFDVITLNNVLEHIENPDLVIGKVGELLNKDGLLIVKVPNDFNLIQEEANKFVNNKSWWVCYPDHLNYFNMESLSKLVGDKGFQIVDKMVDYPLDMFLLQGLNYVDNAHIGKQVHEMRKQFEINIGKEKRRTLFRGFANMGIGRNIIIFAKKKGE